MVGNLRFLDEMEAATGVDLIPSLALHTQHLLLYPQITRTLRFNMTCHLEHRLRWEVLRDIYIAKRTSDPPVKCCPRKMSKELEHFAGCFVAALEEFRATDASTDAEMEYYDPKDWGRHEFQSNCGGWWLGYYDSLFWGYLELNLLLVDGEKTAPHMIKGRRFTPAIDVMIGDAQNEQPSHITDHLAPVFEGEVPSPLTPENRKIIRDHAAIMFRCMYSVSGENKLLDKNRVRRMLLGFFNWICYDQVKSEDGRWVEVPSKCCPWTFVSP